jgi:hypothetical protein
LLVLVLGISCGFTTAQTFPFSKLSKAKKLAAQLGTTQIWKLKILMLLFLMSFSYLYILNNVQYLNHKS